MCTESWTLFDYPPGLLRRPGVRPGGARPAYSRQRKSLIRLVHRNFVVNSTVTIRRPMLVAAGGCSNSLRAAVDFELWLRIAVAWYGACPSPTRSPFLIAYVWGSIENEPRNELRAYEALRLVDGAVAEDWPCT